MYLFNPAKVSIPDNIQETVVREHEHFGNGSYKL